MVLLRQCASLRSTHVQVIWRRPLTSCWRQAHDGLTTFSCKLLPDGDQPNSPLEDIRAGHLCPCAGSMGSPPQGIMDLFPTVRTLSPVTLFPNKPAQRVAWKPGFHATRGAGAASHKCDTTRSSHDLIHSRAVGWPPDLVSLV